MKTGLAVILAFLAPALSFAADLPPADIALQKELTALELRSWTAWKDHDGKFFEGFLADDHVEVGFGGTSDKKTVVAGVARGGCTVASFSADHFALAKLGPDTALLTYHAAQDTLCGKVRVPSPVWVSSLYVKRGGHWLNAAYQQTQAAN